MKGGYMADKKTLEKIKYSAALYMRLSKDDDGVSESSSITTQRKMLRAYAMENGFEVYDEYIDDGVSGTTFDRAGFKRMLCDIEAKKINLVITKDLSRLGREYIQAGQYTEIYFPEKKVRYIAINDGYDSDSPYTDIGPFKNVINEMYARDISKKIRSAFITHMQNGDFIGAFAPYGYKRNIENKYQLIIDLPSAEIVREIFIKASQGVTPIEIARSLNARRIITPSMYRCENNSALNIQNFSKRKEWTSSTITKMLHNVVYVGHMAQGKTTKVSFKSKTSVSNKKDDWYLVRNTHEPIISEEIFNIASKRSQLRRCEQKNQFHNIFSGIVRCADCGHNMSTSKSRKKGARYNLVCGGYKLYGKNECSNHFIDYNILCTIVMSEMKMQLNISSDTKERIIKKAQEYFLKQLSSNDNKKDISNLQKRLTDIDSIIGKLYEDYATRIITAERFQKLLDKYELESSEINQQLQNQNKKAEKDSEITYSKLKQALENYTDIKELSQDILFRFIDHIEIYQGEYVKDKNGRYKKQRIKIFFRFKKPDINQGCLWGLDVTLPE